MSTRGAIGFTYNGKDYITYNHGDSYPSWLGKSILEQIPSCLELKDRIKDLTLVDNKTPPTDKDLARISEFLNIDLSVGQQSEQDWYCVLREAQGNLMLYLEMGYMENGFNFLHNSLFCEWAYIVNFDTNKLEVYKGFQKSKPKGRFADVSCDSYGYYAVGLIAEFDLDNLPTYDEFINVLFEVLKKEDPELEKSCL